MGFFDHEWSGSFACAIGTSRSRPRKPFSSGGELLAPAKCPTLLLRRQAVHTVAGHLAILPGKRASASRRSERWSNEVRSPNAPTIVTTLKYKQRLAQAQAHKRNLRASGRCKGGASRWRCARPVRTLFQTDRNLHGARRSLPMEIENLPQSRSRRLILFTRRSA
jgi:hypothetical protein